MGTAEVERFIQHYERLTRHSFATLPEVADYLLKLNASHQCEEVVIR